jgi:hypothetical protein
MYDLTASAGLGANVLGVMLGHGWKDSRNYTELDPGDMSDYVPVVRAQVHVLCVWYTLALFLNIARGRTRSCAPLATAARHQCL